MEKHELEMLKWFADACGFISWCMDNDKDNSHIAETLEHDILGLQRREDCFLPRCNGYAKYWKG